MRAVSAQAEPAQRIATNRMPAARRRMADMTERLVEGLGSNRGGGAACLARMQGSPLSRMLARDEPSLGHNAGRGRAARGRPACRRGRQDRRAAGQSRHPGRRRCRLGAALSQGISHRSAGDRGPGPAVAARAQRHHPAHPAAAKGARLRQDLESRDQRIPAQDHHPRAGRKARSQRSRRWAATSSSIGRCATAIPRSRSRLGDLVARGCERILVVPLYPQYCAATTATVCDEVFRVLTGLRYQPSVRIAPPYYNDPVYIEALASSTGAELVAARLRARCHPRLVPWRAAGLCRSGRPLLCALRRDHSAAARRAQARRSEIDDDVPVALRPRQMARARDRSRPSRSSPRAA